MFLIHSSIFKNIPKIISVTYTLREDNIQSTAEMYLVFYLTRARLSNLTKSKKC